MSARTRPPSSTAPPSTDPWANDSPAVTSPREFLTIGDGDRYVMRLADVPIEFELDRPRWDHGDLVGLLTVRSSLTGIRAYDGVLSVGTFNCSGPRARTDRAKQITEMARTPQIDWQRLIEEFSVRVLRAEATGQPGIDLRTVPRPSADDVLEIHGVPILERHPIIWFGDGGVAKSYLALWFSGEISRCGVKVLYADWELSKEDHRDRLERLFGADMPEIIYARCSRPLSAEVDRLKRLVAQHDIGYLVCDSVAFACDGPPEAAEVAGRYMQAIRQIGIGSLHLAHVTKGDNADQRPFGSAFWHNGARSTWNIKLASSEAGGQGITVGMFNRKTNLGPLRPALGFRVSFSHDQTVVYPTDPAKVDEFAAQVPVRQRMYGALKEAGGKPRTIAELAELTGAPKDTIEKTAKRHQTTFTRVSGEDGITRIALVDRRAS